MISEDIWLNVVKQSRISIGFDTETGGCTLIRRKFFTTAFTIGLLAVGIACSARLDVKRDIWQLAPQESVLVAGFDWRPENSSVRVLKSAQTPEAQDMLARQQVAMRKAYENLATLFGISLDFAKDIGSWAGQESAFVLVPDGKQGVQPVLMIASNDAASADLALNKILEPWQRLGDVTLVADKDFSIRSFKAADKSMEVYAAVSGSLVAVSPSKSALALSLHGTGFAEGTPGYKAFKSLEGSMFYLYADPSMAEKMGTNATNIPLTGLGVGLTVVDAGVKLKALGFVAPDQAALAKMALSGQQQGSLSVNPGIPSTTLVAASLPQISGLSGMAGMFGMGDSPIFDTVLALSDTQMSVAMTAALPVPGGVATAMAESDQAAGEKVGKIVANLRKMKVPVTEAKAVSGQKTYQFTIPKGPKVTLTQIGKHVVVATDPQSLTSAAVTINGAQAGVADSLTYKETIANLDNSNLVTIYANLAPLRGLGYLTDGIGLGLIEPIYGALAKSLQKVQALGIGAGFDGDAVHATVFLRANPEIGTDIAPVALTSAIIGSAVLFPVFSQVRDQASKASCVYNLQELAKAAMLYQSDFEKLPVRTKWQSQLEEYIQGEVKCAQGDVVYAFNKNLSGLDIDKIKNPSQVVMFFEASPGLPNASGSRADALLPHNGQGAFAYVDGHVEQQWEVPSQYHWVPKYAQPKAATKKTPVKSRR